MAVKAKYSAGGEYAPDWMIHVSYLAFKLSQADLVVAC